MGLHFDAGLKYGCFHIGMTSVVILRGRGAVAWNGCYAALLVFKFAGSSLLDQEVAEPEKESHVQDNHAPAQGIHLTP